MILISCLKWIFWMTSPYFDVIRTIKITENFFFLFLTNIYISLVNNCIIYSHFKRHFWKYFNFRLSCRNFYFSQAISSRLLFTMSFKFRHNYFSWAIININSLSSSPYRIILTENKINKLFFQRLCNLRIEFSFSILLWSNRFFILHFYILLLIIILFIISFVII